MKTYLRKRQQGAAIFMALIMLLVMTVIGITASQTTTLEEKMSGNLRDQTVALQAAEAVLRATETWIDNLTAEPTTVTSCTSDCDTAVWQKDTLDLTSAATWSSTPTSVRTNYAGLTVGEGQVAAQPTSAVESYFFVSDSFNTGKQTDVSGQSFYRVTAQGTGGTTSAQSLLQTTYSRRF